MQAKDLPVSVDIELTNRCNAKCHFCPRDATPHQGLMTPEVFEQSLARAVELRDLIDEVSKTRMRVSLCGLGEPLLNKHAADFVRQVRAEDIRCGISSNGALLDEARATALLDAGLQHIYLNVGERGQDYDDVYHLPWQKTYENVVRFREMAEGRCEINLVLVDHRRDPTHVADMRSFWEDHGIKNFFEFGIMNRGGTLFVDEMQYGSYPERVEAIERLGGEDTKVVCPVPFVFVFIGYDGNHYLCCSDWEKKAPVGNVFDSSFADVLAAKYRHVLSREPICRSCNHDPINNLTDAMRSRAAGDLDADAVEATAVELISLNDTVTTWIDDLRPGSTAGATRTSIAPPADDGRKRIPLTVTGP